MEISIDFMAQYMHMELDSLVGLINNSEILGLAGKYLNALQLLQLITTVIRPYDDDLYHAVMEELKACSQMVITMRNERLGIVTPDDSNTKLTYEDYLKGAALFIIGLSGVYPEGTSTIH